MFAANLKIAFRKCLGIPTNKYGGKFKNNDYKHHQNKAYDKRKKTGSNSGDEKFSTFKQNLIKYLTNYK